MNIRLATDGDAALLARIAEETFPLACPPDTSPKAIRAFIDANLSEHSFAGYLADANRVLHLAFVDDEPAGYTMIVRGEPSDTDVAAAVTTRPTTELSKVYVRPGFHGAGVAQALVEAAVGAAGSPSVWLGVNIHNAKANRFYEKMGFAQVGTKQFLVGDRYEDDYVRERIVG